MKTNSSIRTFPIRNTFFAITLGLFGLAPHGFGETANFSPIADSEIHRFTDPDTSYGINLSVVSGKLNNGETRRALFRFDISSVPAQATVTSVTLRLRVVMVPSGGGANSTFDLRRILKDWSETSVTWNNRVSPASPWESGGVSGSSDASAEASSSSSVSGNGPYTFVSTPKLVADVQSWVANSGTNFGWLLISQDEVTAQTARHFGSREDADNAPLLTIDYTLPPPPASTNIVLTGAVLAGNEFRFSFNAESNRAHTVESLTSLSSSNWQSVTTFPPASAALIRTVTNGITASNAFFRVRTP